MRRLWAVMARQDWVVAVLCRACGVGVVRCCLGGQIRGRLDDDAIVLLPGEAPVTGRNGTASPSFASLRVARRVRHLGL